MTATPFLIGITLALSVGAFATIAGLDRERGFYPTVLIVVGSYYALFAVQGSTPSILAWEAAGMLLFAALAVSGFKISLWIVVAGLAGHGLFDAIHGHLFANPGTPAWWPAFCSAYDLTAAAWLAFRIKGEHGDATPTPRPQM